MFRSEDLRSWTPTDEILNHQLASIKVTLWPDPYMVPDLALSVEPPLKICPRPDEDSIAELKSLKMFEPDLVANQEAVAAAPCDGTKNRSPHQKRKWILAA